MKCILEIEGSHKCVANFAQEGKAIMFKGHRFHWSPLLDVGGLPYMCTAHCTSYIHIFLCVDTEIKKTNIIWGAISRVINFFWLGDNKITLMTWLLCNFENTWNTYCQYQLLPRPVRKKPWLILIYCIRIWEWAFISRESKKCVSPLWKGSCSYCQHFFDITHLFHLFPSL